MRKEGSDFDITVAGEKIGQDNQPVKNQIAIFCNVCEKALGLICID